MPGYQMNKQKMAKMGGDPAAQAAAPDLAPADDQGSGDATQAKQLLQQLSDVIDHWDQSEKGEESAEMPQPGGEQGY